VSAAALRLLLLPKSGHAVGLDEAAWQVIDEWLTPPAGHQQPSLS